MTAILTLRAFGASINTMTLGGMAIAIGALVDDAIIDVENIIRRLRENAALPADRQRSAMEVIFRASVEVRASIVFATLIIMLVFVPLFFLSGVEGRLLFPLGVAFVVSLVASLVSALTLTPALSYYLLPASKTVRQGGEPWLVRTVKRLYARPLDLAMRHPWWVVVPTAILLVASVVGVSTMGRSFLPEFSEGALVVGLVSVPGISLEESDKLAHVVENTLMQHPEIAAIGRRTGRGEADAHGMNTEGSEIDLTLDMEAPSAWASPRRTRAELLEAIRRDVATIPGVKAQFGQPIGHRIDHMLSGTRANIAVKVFGEDLLKLRELAKEVERAMGQIPGVVDLSTEQQNDIPIRRVEFDRRTMARYGLKMADVATALQTAFRGDAVTQVLEGRYPFDLIVRCGDPANPQSWENTSSERVGEVLVDTPGGTKIPLKAVARISEERGPNMISRENAQRKIEVTCNVAGRALDGVVADIRRTVAEQVKLPQGYYVQYGGQFESAEATRQRLGILGIMVILGIGFLLHIVFRSAARHVADHDQPAAGPDRGRRRRVCLRRRVVRRVRDRFHQRVRHRGPERHHDGFPHPAPSAIRRGNRLSRGRSPRCDGTTGPDPDDRPGCRPCPGSLGAGRRAAGARDPDSYGDRHRLRPIVVDLPQHGRRPRPLRAIRAPD